MLLKDCGSKDIEGAWASLKRENPLVFHVTNAVASALSANVCLAIGASPLMSQYPGETEELIGIARGFLVNLGTPSAAAMETVERGMEAARSRAPGTAPFTLLDPVGYGASRFRVESTDALLNRYSFSIVKGNAGEISLLAKVGGAIKGVDAASTGDLRKGVLALARERRCVACATGEIDFLSDGESVALVRGGSALLPALSGSGCAVGTIVLSVTAACGDAVLGTLCGLAAMGIASERAEKKCAGSGTFPAALLDELYALRPEDFQDSRTRWSL
ncbi:MAG: hydroxyethylthiazole kinase [Synergistaceae bacterium]|nr:hydroxyethylthiazole kinase [Synergistaceae bacterium]